MKSLVLYNPQQLEVAAHLARVAEVAARLMAMGRKTRVLLGLPAPAKPGVVVTQEMKQVAAAGVAEVQGAPGQAISEETMINLTAEAWIRKVSQWIVRP